MTVSGVPTPKPPTCPAPESLHVQLAQINERSRAYTTQLWAIPVAYSAGAGVLLGQLHAAADLTASLALTATGIVGGLLIWHSWNMKSAAHRAVDEILKVEAALGLASTARKRAHHVPLMLAAGLVAVTCLVIGLRTLPISVGPMSIFKAIGIAGLALTLAGATLLFFKSVPRKEWPGFQLIGSMLIETGSTATPDQRAQVQAEATKHMQRAGRANRLGFGLVALGTVAQIVSMWSA